MRLIDADKLSKKFEPKPELECFATDLNGIQRILSDAPTVEAIPTEKIETAIKLIRARFMDSNETVMQNEQRRAVSKEFIEILKATMQDCDADCENCKYNGCIFTALNKTPEEQMQTHERHRGQWVKYLEMGGVFGNKYKCSICGRSVTALANTEAPENSFPFCHCGADMRRDVNDSRANDTV